MKSVAHSIKDLRIKTKLSQKRFGYKIGISGKTISAYETGKCTPPLKVLEKISHTYKISISTFTVSSDELLIEKIKRLQEDINEISKVMSLYPIS
ncbi:MAG: hypothetical protein RLY61_717 [Candidatus Parcubacteria bacterium]|jgi:transcriptional regulator with XRE-family HTH domain